MKKSYKHLDAAAATLVNDIMTQHHAHLVDANVTLSSLFVFGPRDKRGQKTSPALVFSGYRALACIKITNLRDRTLGVGDALLQIDGDDWPDWNGKKRRAIIDHELCHLEVGDDLDSLDRPILHLHLHDFQTGGFLDVIHRHRKHAVECEQINQILASGDQLKLPFEPSEQLAEVA